MTEQKRRYACRLIDLAIGRCEEGNLHDHLELPRWIADLVVQLEAAAGEELVVPPDTIAAHGQLLDLRHNFMPRSSPLRASDPELERRLCATCSRLMRPLSQQSDCTNCRRLQRLIKRAQVALAS